MSINNSKIAVKVEDLTVYYQQTLALWDLDFEIPANTISAIIGPNGAGKSTLMKCFLHLLSPTAGSITYFNNKNYNEVKSCLSYVPQRENINWNFPTTVFEVVLMGRYAKLGWFKNPKKEDYEIVERTLEKLEMLKFKDLHISQLSGGQQQRVFLARSLVQEADIYFLDEILAGIDKKTEKIVIDTFQELKQQNKTIVVIHHDLSLVNKYFDYVVMLNKKIISYGDIKNTFIPQNIKKTFGGMVEDLI